MEGLNEAALTCMTGSFRIEVEYRKIDGEEDQIVFTNIFFFREWLTDTIFDLEYCKFEIF